MTRLRTTREVVDALGGASELAPRLGIGRTAIQNWLANDYIPVRAADAIRAALSEINLTCPDDLFRPRLLLKPQHSGYAA